MNENCKIIVCKNKKQVNNNPACRVFCGFLLLYILLISIYLLN